MTISELKENSIRIPGSTVTCRPQYLGKESIIDITRTRSIFNRSYSVKNSIICFIDEEELYVTPYTNKIMTIIKNAGLSKRSFYVPFSDGEYPKYDAAKWFHLCRLARESRYQEYEETAAQWCNEHGINKISDETMRNCLKIPHSGIEIEHPFFETTYYPICLEIGPLSYSTAVNLGKYSINKNRVVFVYCDGHTYITKGIKIVDELTKSGYKESNLFVPMSNDETIVDPYIAIQWDKIPEE